MIHCDNDPRPPGLPRRVPAVWTLGIVILAVAAQTGCAATSGKAATTPLGGARAAAAPAPAAEPDEGQSGLPARNGKLDAGIAVLDRAETLYAQGQWSAAQAAFTQMSTQYPRNAYFWFRRGNCDARLGSFESAAQAYQMAVSLDETDGRFSYNLGLVRLAQARAALDHAQRRLDGNALLKLEAQRLFEGIQPRFDGPLAQAQVAPRSPVPTTPPLTAPAVAP